MENAHFEPSLPKVAAEDYQAILNQLIEKNPRR